MPSCCGKLQRQDAQLHMNYLWKTSYSIRTLSGFLVKDGSDADDMVCRTVHEIHICCMRYLRLDNAYHESVQGAQMCRTEEEEAR